MARIADIDQKAWNEWVESRPTDVQELCKKLPPDRLYRMKSTGHRVTLCAYSENGTVTVNVSGEYNVLTFDREVFGIDPEDLDECDLPTENEPLGTLLVDDEDVTAFIDEIRLGGG